MSRSRRRLSGEPSALDVAIVVMLCALGAGVGLAIGVPALFDRLF